MGGVEGKSVFIIKWTLERCMTVRERRRFRDRELWKALKESNDVTHALLSGVLYVEQPKRKVSTLYFGLGALAHWIFCLSLPCFLYLCFCISVCTLLVFVCLAGFKSVNESMCVSVCLCSWLWSWPSSMVVLCLCLPLHPCCLNISWACGSTEPEGGDMCVLFDTWHLLGCRLGCIGVVRGHRSEQTFRLILNLHLLFL